MIKGSLKRNGKDYKPGGGYGRRKLSTLIARQLVNGALRPFTNMGPGHGPSAPTAQEHKAQGGQHKQPEAGGSAMGFDEINESKKRKRKGNETTSTDERADNNREARRGRGQ